VGGERASAVVEWWLWVAVCRKVAAFSASHFSLGPTADGCGCASVLEPECSPPATSTRAHLPISIARQRQDLPAALQGSSTELHDLPLLALPRQIMEALGGDQAWFDRFCAYHAAIVYYWVLVRGYAPRCLRSTQLAPLLPPQSKL